ncbi:unnamed protein product [Microthlaspi erraticum]|uniref:FBD domain-containing protein n=1 Tax=Microthlaspi erraticum TaxID=1685480 RepID=A0A6D2I9M5_9BRAS|nr:unnamed protein product [Microthlaspi erraticum]
MVPKLKFTFSIRNGDNDVDLQRFSDNVCRSMLSLQTPVLQSLHLEVIAKKSGTIDFGVLVGIAFGHHVRELVLTVEFSQGSFRFPINLYKCEMLETLKLGGCGSSIILDVTSPVCLKSLRTLHLHYVFFKDEESVLNLLSGCESLETLLVRPSRNDDVKTFTIAVPSLQKLTIQSGYGDGADYVINAPSLKYLNIEACHHYGSFLIENAPQLVEAEIFSGNVIMGSLTSLKHLTLSISHLEMKVPAGSIFNQLVYLKLFPSELEDWNLLMLILDNSPILQVLKIQSGYGVEARNEWKAPKHVPQCLSLHLKTLDWCVDGIEYGEEVAEYILENASRLEKLILSFDVDNYSLSEEDKLQVWHAMESMCPYSCEFDLVG